MLVSLGNPSGISWLSSYDFGLVHGLFLLFFLLTLNTSCLSQVLHDIDASLKNNKDRCKRKGGGLRKRQVLKKERN